MKKLMIILALSLGLIANAQEKFSTFYIYNYFNTADAKTAVFTPIVAIQIEDAGNWKIQEDIRNQFKTYLTNYVKDKMKINVDEGGFFGLSDVWQRSAEMDREHALEYAAQYQKDKKILFTGQDFNFKYVKTIK